ncbi:universal stress protein [Streptomyces sp. KLMMK]|uniref:universal stress protein n=1 Tax=Streptomyces sp. KLMMK TaxID=3109353 RepID=UPI00300A2D79
MPRTVIAGLDGSPESLAAAEWAAREARLRGLPLTLLHALEDWSPTYGLAALSGVEFDPASWAGSLLAEVSGQLGGEHPGLDIRTEQLEGRPVERLVAAAKEAEVLVLGSRGLGALSGFLTGSVSMSVLARAERPVVLVRAGERAGREQEAYGRETRGEEARDGEAYGDVVLGVDLARPCDELFAYAFEAAAARGARLRVVHGWSLPPLFGYDPAAVDPGHIAGLATRESTALTDALRPWCGKYPGVPVDEQCVVGRPGEHLTEASATACLVVVGRRARRSVIGARLGPVTHAVLHHATAPVAVVPHN